MSVKLRFVRIGKKNHPAFRLCAIESRKARDGQYLENLGFYDPFIPDEKKKLRFNKERAEYWLSVGALPSHTVLNFFKKEKISGLIRKAKPKRRKKTARPQAGRPSQAGAGAGAGPSIRKPKPPKKPKPSRNSPLGPPEGTMNPPLGPPKGTMNPPLGPPEGTPDFPRGPGGKSDLAAEGA